MCAVYRMEFEHWTAERALGEMRDLGYAANHRDVFSYLENYQPRGYSLGKRVVSPPHRFCNLAARAPF